jgi:hypothetical protein
MNEYYEYFGPTYRLDVPQSNTDDLNTPEYLEKIKVQVFENLRQTCGGGAPSVQQQRAFLSLSAFPFSLLPAGEQVEGSTTDFFFYSHSEDCDG